MTTAPDFFQIETDGFDVPHFDQYFGVWAILEAPFRQALLRAESLDLRSHLQQPRYLINNAIIGVDPAKATDNATPESRSMMSGSSTRFSYDVIHGGIAVIELSGPLMKHASSFSRGSSTAFARRQIRNAVNDEAVNSILLHIDSPGGTVAGTGDLAADIRDANKQKTVFAYIEDLGASAAYWLASQSSKVYANPSGAVGSIGTYMAMYDLSQMAENEGVAVHVIRAGDFKGAGTPGTPITDEQLAEWQRLVNQLNAQFTAGVKSGRRMGDKQLEKVTDGRVHIGDDAINLKLIDGIRSIDEVVAELRNLNKNSSSTKGRQQMTIATNANADGTPDANSSVVAGVDDIANAIAGKLQGNQAATSAAPQQQPQQAAPQQPTAATLRELKAACVGADNDFLISQLEKSATVAQAQTAWMAEQNARIEAMQQQTDTTASNPKKPIGNTVAVGTTTTVQSQSAGDPIAEWNQLIQTHMNSGLTRPKAVRKAAAENPDLRASFVEAYNAEHNPKKR